MKLKALSAMVALCFAFTALSTGAEAGSKHRHKGHHAGHHHKGNHHKGYHRKRHKSGIAHFGVGVGVGYLLFRNHHGHHRPHYGRHHYRHHHGHYRRHYRHHRRHHHGHRYHPYRGASVYYADPGYQLPPVAQQVRPVQAKNDGRYCREYQTPVIIDGKEQMAYGEACFNKDGAWQQR